MKVLITYSSSWKENAMEDRTEEINTLEDLLNLMKKEGNDLIISPKQSWTKEDVDFEIEVYNGYRE